MSEWIDFCIYALQAVMLWIVLPQWAKRAVRPMLMDRNPAWVESHQAVVGQSGAVPFRDRLHPRVLANGQTCAT